MKYGPLTPEEAMKSSVKKHLDSGAMDTPDNQLNAIEQFGKEFKLKPMSYASHWARIVAKVGKPIKVN